MTELTTSNTPRIRTLKACNQCRQRKVKCDGTSQCSNCIKYSVCCVYDPMPSKRVGRKKGVKPLKKKNGATNNSRVNKVEFSRQKKLGADNISKLSNKVNLKDLNLSTININGKLPSGEETPLKIIPKGPESQNLINESSVPTVSPSADLPASNQHNLDFGSQKSSYDILRNDHETTSEYEMKLSDSINKICESIDSMGEKHGIPELASISKEFLSLSGSDEKESSFNANDKLLNLVNQQIPLLLERVDSALNSRNESIFIASPLTSISSMNTYKDNVHDQDEISFDGEYQQMSTKDTKNFSPSHTPNIANIEVFNTNTNPINNNEVIVDNLEESMFAKNDFNNTSCDSSNIDDLITDNYFSSVSMFFNNELPMEFNDSLMIS